jgi:hypothetical protein
MSLNLVTSVQTPTIICCLHWGSVFFCGSSEQVNHPNSSTEQSYSWEAIRCQHSQGILWNSNFRCCQFWRVLGKINYTLRYSSRHLCDFVRNTSRINLTPTSSSSPQLLWSQSWVPDCADFGQLRRNLVTFLREERKRWIVRNILFLFE